MSDTEHVTELTSTERLDALMEQGAERTAIIDFWSPTCGPCKRMAPHFDEAADELADDPVEFIKINTQSNPRMAQAFNVRSVPTILLVHDGEVLDTLVGALPEDRLEDKAEWLLSKARGEGFLQRMFG
jgi:thioredoxin